MKALLLELKEEFDRELERIEKNHRNNLRLSWEAFKNKYRELFEELKSLEEPDDPEL